jgi:hypothetical protein
LRLAADLEKGLGVGKEGVPVRLQVREEELEQQEPEEME